MAGAEARSTLKRFYFGRAAVLGRRQVPQRWCGGQCPPYA